MEFSVSGLDELMLSMKEIEEIPEAVVDEMLNAQADVLIPEIQERARAYGVVDSGKTIKSIKKGKPKTKKGLRFIVVKPYGTRIRKSQKISNAEIAFLNEYGTRETPARPFFRDACEISAKTMTKAAFGIYDRWLKSKNL